MILRAYRKLCLLALFLCLCFVLFYFVLWCLAVQSVRFIVRGAVVQFAAHTRVHDTFRFIMDGCAS